MKRYSRGNNAKGRVHFYLYFSGINPSSMKKKETPRSTYNNI